MKKSTLPLVIVSLALSAVVAQASGPIAVYTIVERVVLEPNDSAPERAQIWGVFSVRNNRDGSYGAAQRGYLYYKIDESVCRSAPTKACVADVQKQTRAIWSDLKKKAGKGQAVGFGGAFNQFAAAAGQDGSGVPKVRQATDKVESPEALSLGNPVVDLGSSQADIAARLKAALPTK